MRKTIFAALAAFLTQSAMAGVSFNLPWMNSTTPNATYNTAENPNSVFVLETYFLGCPYCNENAENVHALQEEFAFDMRVQILDVGIDTQDWQFAEWIRRHQPNHPVVKDVGRQLVRQLGVRAYPTVVLVDCTGNVAYKYEGEWNESVKSTIRTKIKSALEGCKKNDE